MHIGGTNQAPFRSRMQLIVSRQAKARVMSAKTSVEKNIRGPSGFLEFGGQILVVDFGRIYHEGAAIGLLFDDGYLQHTSGLLGNHPKLRPIEALEGCVFRGIDSGGMELVLPEGERGPSGSLKFNGVLYHVINGRIAAPDHTLVGEFDDQGQVSIRDQRNKVPRRKLDENSQLSTVFDGKKSNGEAWKHEWVRPLVRRDKNYSDSEMIRYFMDYDKINGTQKKYLFENLRLWASTGLLQVVRRSEGNCALGNVKHGAAGQTGVRTGNVTLDREELDRDTEYYYKHGCFAAVYTRFKPFLEVRVNLVVAHEYGHQLEFCLSQACQERVKDLYHQRRQLSDKLPRPPEDYTGEAELVLQEMVAKRAFISGYARCSFHEYWAECVAAFSIKESRDFLQTHDPQVYEILMDVIFAPEKVLRPVLVEPILTLQASLRVGGEMHDKILDE